MKKNEEEYLNKLEKKFKQYGYKTYREVIPDQCKNWDYPYRVDMIVIKEQNSIGIEGKHINTPGSGGIIAKAIKQIQKYRELTYEGRKIKHWALAFKTETSMNLDGECWMIKEFLKYFLQEYDIYFVHWNNYKLELCKGNTNKKIKIYNNYD